MQVNFSTGTLIMKRTDVTNTPPALLGVLSEVDVEIDRKIEKLLGQYNMAVALAGGEFSISGKAKFARMQATQFANLLLGPNATVTTPAMLEMTTGESQTPSGTAFTVANGATFVEDYGVFYAATGTQLTPVASGPSQGQYIAGGAGVGTYTINASDENAALLIYYSYTITSGGNKITLANALMGPLPTFELIFKESFTYLGTAKDIVLKLNACSSSKLTLPFAQGKFNVSEMDWQAQADAANNIGYLSMSE